MPNYGMNIFCSNNYSIKKISTLNPVCCLSYKLKFPFNKFVNSNILENNVTKSFEPINHEENQYIETKNNSNV